jgi:hypothetical protein
LKPFFAEVSNQELQQVQLKVVKEVRCSCWLIGAKSNVENPKNLGVEVVFQFFVSQRFVFS